MSLLRVLWWARTEVPLRMAISVKRSASVSPLRKSFEALNQAHRMLRDPDLLAEVKDMLVDAAYHGGLSLSLLLDFPLSWCLPS